jgi:hypothetical protein
MDMVFLVFQIIGMIHVLNWWHLFDAAGLTGYAHQCHLLFGLMMVVPGVLAFILLILIVLGIWWIVGVLVSCFGGGD